MPDADRPRTGILAVDNATASSAPMPAWLVGRLLFVVRAATGRCRGIRGGRGRGIRGGGPVAGGVARGPLEFTNADGGGYGGRLRLMQLPGCAPSTPDVPAGQGAEAGEHRV